jgi:hypothetical protein
LNMHIGIEMFSARDLCCDSKITRLIIGVYKDKITFISIQFDVTLYDF